MATKKIDETKEVNESFGCPTYDNAGRNILYNMNNQHEEGMKWIFQFINLEKSFNVLEVGCGGGVNIKRMVGKVNHITGIDISKMSCTVSSEINEESIKKNLVKIEQGNIENYQGKDDSFDIITAFSTVFFWTDRPTSFKNVFRMLKKGGSFYLGFGTKESLLQWKHVPGLIVTDEYEIMKELTDAGFDDQTLFLWRETGWLLLKATK